MAKRPREDEDPLPSSSQASTLLDDGDRAVAKYTQTERRNEQVGVQGLMRCYLPPHKPISFATYEDYDSHYQQTHVHRCSQCRKNFPSPHFTDLHIAENHDPLNEARKARGDKIYGCFVEDCDKLCSTPQKRRMHLVDKHHFPKNYNFYVVNDGIDRRKSMLRLGFEHRRRASLLESPDHDSATSSTTKSHASDQSPSTDAESAADKGGLADAGSEESETEHPIASSTTRNLESSSTPACPRVDDDELEDITKSMSALKFVPPSVRFGRGRGRGFSRR